MNKINELLKKEERNQKWLAKHMGVCRQTVWRWNKGLLIPDIFTMFKLAKILNVTIKELTHENRTINHSNE